MITTAGSLFATPPTVPKRFRTHGRNASISDGNSIITRHGLSSLILNSSEVILNSDVTIVLTWCIAENVNPLDWIGLYLIGKIN